MRRFRECRTTIKTYQRCIEIDVRWKEICSGYNFRILLNDNGFSLISLRVLVILSYIALLYISHIYQSIFQFSDEPLPYSIYFHAHFAYSYLHHFQCLRYVILLFQMWKPEKHFSGFFYQNSIWKTLSTIQINKSFLELIFIEYLPFLHFHLKIPH